MRYYRLYALAFWLGVALILGYEFYALSLNSGLTISEIVWRLSTTHPLIPFSGGVLCGHFWWQSTSVYRGYRK